MQFPSAQDIQTRLVSDRRLTAALVGITIGISAAILGILLALGGPLLALGAIIGVSLGLYILTDLMAALTMTIAVVAMLPFGTLPVKVALVPTFIDVTLGSFLLVYLFQWMTGKRTALRLVPAHAIILVFILFTLFSFVAGLGHASLTPSVLRKFVELLLAIGIAIVIVDVARDEQTLRRIALVIIVFGGVQALIGLVLYVINPVTAERLLNTLGRFGYPVGGVIRYINDDPDLAERAIGTWVDPNAYGGFLMMIAAVTGVQVLAHKPVTGKRWFAAAIFVIIALPLWLTQSRGAVIGLAAVIIFVAALRYRWLLILMVVVAAALIFLPFTQAYIDRFVEGITGQDLSTQMRLGEYKDALILIGRYPIIGVGFAGAPDRDIYLGVSMLYLKIAGATGLVGLALFLAAVAEMFRYGWVRWSRLVASPSLFSLWLGFTGGVVGALVSGIFDHYYFNIEFNGAAIMFWLFVGLSLAAARIAIADDAPLPALK
ncbi:MAG: O-antigen ligase family protein [Chloroflexota bacterium]